jgi:hypothetical protein
VPEIFIKERGNPTLNVPLTIILSREGAEHLAGTVRASALQNSKHLAPGRAEEILKTVTGTRLRVLNRKIDASLFFKFSQQSQGVLPAFTLTKGMAGFAALAISGAVNRV